MPALSIDCFQQQGDDGAGGAGASAEWFVASSAHDTRVVLSASLHSKMDCGCSSWLKPNDPSVL